MMVAIERVERRIVQYFVGGAATLATLALGLARLPGDAGLWAALGLG